MRPLRLSPRQDRCWALCPRQDWATTLVHFSTLSLSVWPTSLKLQSIHCIINTEHSVSHSIAVSSLYKFTLCLLEMYSIQYLHWLAELLHAVLLFRHVLVSCQLNWVLISVTCICLSCLTACMTSCLLWMCTSMLCICRNDLWGEDWSW